MSGKCLTHSKKLCLVNLNIYVKLPVLCTKHQKYNLSFPAFQLMVLLHSPDLRVAGAGFTCEVQTQETTGRAEQHSGQ